MTPEVPRNWVWEACSPTPGSPGYLRRGRYDLVRWNHRGRPTAVIEYKWRWYKTKLQIDVKNVCSASKKMGVTPFVCVLVPDEDPEALKKNVATQLKNIAKAARIVGSHEQSNVVRIPVYCEGRPAKKELHFQAIAVKLRAKTRD